MLRNLGIYYFSTADKGILYCIEKIRNKYRFK